MPRRHIPHNPIRYQPPINTDCQNKRRYPTEKQARTAADTQMLTNMQLELDVYQCLYCRHWHLTSRNPK